MSYFGLQTRGLREEEEEEGEEEEERGEIKLRYGYMAFVWNFGMIFVYNLLGYE